MVKHATMLALASIGLWVAATAGQAATLTYANNWNYIVPSGISLSGTNYYASTNDLANAGQPTLASAVWSGGANGAYGSSPAQLNNGLYALAELSGGVPDGYVNAGPTDSTLLATPNSTYTITFTGGMDITSVAVYAAMTGTTRAKQNWKLEYRLAGSGSYQAIVSPFIALNVAQNSNGNRQGAWYNKITLTSGATELRNVDSLRFTFLKPSYYAPTDGSNSNMLETAYREIDVFGAATTCPTITLSPATLSAGTVGATYSNTITASGGIPAYSYAVTEGGLPAGLSLAAGGALTGTPTAAGSTNFTVTAIDANGCSGSSNYTINVTEQPPTLGITVSNSLTTVYWPASSDPGFVLEANSDLTSTNWVDAGTPFVEGGNNVVTNSIQGDALFFRLKK